ncbi:MAG TPA: RNA polymerase sigma factor [Candidatus Binatia bacterium]|nr:RNA polymerase sigma factor [Candidatus Binatia bacterium]
MALRFEELIARHHDEIFAYLWRLLGKDGRREGATDVEDIVQDIFLRAYESFSRLRPESNYRAWLYKIATHCAYTQLRRMKDRRDKLSSLKDSATEWASADARFDPHMQQRVRDLVSELPAKQRASVTLRYLQDLNYPEIAQILNCSQESARANVYQAVRQLRRLIREERW